jgi:prepilin signal peptidase PulO-like enzyme (type II secretory pathway)
LLAIPIEVRIALATLLGAVLGLLAVLAWRALRSPGRPPLRLVSIPAVLVVLIGAVGFGALYDWETTQQGLKPQAPVAFLPNGQQFVVRLPNLAPEVVHGQFAVHVLLLWVMLVASLIDFDEQIIPDIVTAPTTILGLVIATAVPWTLLPAARYLPPPVFADLSFLQFTSPDAWPARFSFPAASPLALALACWWLWCVGLMHRTWYARHGWRRAFGLMVERLRRDSWTPRYLGLGVLGSVALAAAWRLLPVENWQGLLTALVGMAGGGVLIWVVRLIGRGALGLETIGFGDVTLMATIGAFVGWQSCLAIFFLAPFPALVMGAVVFLLRRHNVIPYGPFLCLAATFVIVRWRFCWDLLEGILLALGMWVPVILLACLALMGPLLILVRAARVWLFPLGPNEK